MNRKKFQIVLMVFVTFPILSIAVLAATGTFIEKELPNYGTVPQFSLTERSGETISSNKFIQKVWIANFIFTHCSGQCPIIMEEGRKVQRVLRLKENFRLVSITVDPENDDAATLKEYANRFNADPYKWLFLTGKHQDIQNLVQKGFKLSADKEGGEPGGDVTHSSKFVLVDGFGSIRGYYDANESKEMNQLIRDAKKLIKKTFLN
jgi:protein SCO1